MAGMLLAELPFAQQIRADVSALRAIFVTLFFASIGLIAQLPSEESLLTLAALVAGIIFLKAFLVGGVVRIFRQPPAVGQAGRTKGSGFRVPRSRFVSAGTTSTARSLGRLAGKTSPLT